MQRREFILAAAVGALAGRSKAADRAELTLGFSLYGMKGLKTEDGIRKVAEIGFDSVELCLLPGYDAEPKNLSAARRQELRRVLGSSRLKLPALMENLDLKGTADQQKPLLERLRRAGEVAHDFVPDAPPLIETVMGNGDWSKVKQQFRDNLGGWAKVAEETKTVVAVKPHRSNAVNRPEDAVWLVEQVSSPWVKLAYDYSHFIHRDLAMADTVRVMAPHVRFVHVKDTVIKDGKAAFVLAGESGQIDYVQLLKLLRDAGYRGDVCCEVSGMVSNQPGYDPIAAARTCYKNMAAAFDRAALRRT